MAYVIVFPVCGYHIHSLLDETVYCILRYMYYSVL